MLRIFYLVLVGAFSTHAAETGPIKPTLQARAAIAKVAFEWLLFDAWPSLDDKDLVGVSLLAKSRNAFQTSEVAVFQVNIVDSNLQLMSPLLYDRTAKVLTVNQDSSPRWDRTTVCVEIHRAKGHWTVGVIYRLGVKSDIEITRKDQNYYVSKYIRTSYDCR